MAKDFFDRLYHYGIIFFVLVEKKGLEWEKGFFSCYVTGKKVLSSYLVFPAVDLVLLLHPSARRGI